MGSGVGKTLCCAALAALAAACAPGETHECIVSADCPSGTCEDGMCTGGTDGGGEDAGSDQPDADPARCSANLDGVIERDEIPLQVGLTASFRVATDSAVDTAGTMQPAGTRSWDFSNALPGDKTVEVTLAPIAGQWFAAAFPGADYWTPLAQGQELRGVFEITDASLLLRGVVSPNGGATRTELVYDPPVAVMRFPLFEGTHWSTTATITGVAAGVPSLYTETYDYTADAVGDLVAPFGTFDVTRVRGELTRTVGVVVTTSRSFLFSSECFGTVASVFSNDYETEIEFSAAREVRRLTP